MAALMEISWDKLLNFEILNDDTILAFMSVFINEMESKLWLLSRDGVDLFVFILINKYKTNDLQLKPKTVDVVANCLIVLGILLTDPRAAGKFVKVKGGLHVLNDLMAYPQPSISERAKDLHKNLSSMIERNDQMECGDENPLNRLNMNAANSICNANTKHNPLKHGMMPAFTSIDSSALKRSISSDVIENNDLSQQQCAAFPPPKTQKKNRKRTFEELEDNARHFQPPKKIRKVGATVVDKFRNLPSLPDQMIIRKGSEAWNDLDYIRFTTQHKETDFQSIYEKFAESRCCFIKQYSSNPRVVKYVDNRLKHA
eukprot:408695_1